MIHARSNGTYTVSVINKQRMYAFIVDVDSLADAKHVERALKLTMPPQGERQAVMFYATLGNARPFCLTCDDTGTIERDGAHGDIVNTSCPDCTKAAA